MEWGAILLFFDDVITFWCVDVWLKYAAMLFFMFKFCATLGALCVPLAYLTVWELTKSTGASLLSTGFIVFGKLSH